eukprot:10818383-Alexandrium_andersonii.AAC.1
MSASLVGSEMCIRDRPWPGLRAVRGRTSTRRCLPTSPARSASPTGRRCSCLLYTSDAADDM